MDFNIIQKDSVPVCPVDASGCFTAEVADFAGQYVKDADKNIIKALKEQGRLVHTSSFKHNYPFCWRYGEELIQYMFTSQIADKFFLQCCCNYSYLENKTSKFLFPVSF
ncbi:isoleucine--tRNA ligase, cytoplasmic-like [Sceloporus undulatus]|uniref:isoleucine--tRNA ligase, cytoplasmic-like n=1 Tax=Sceloporus undulatus TaxID=8520 RepID=UPI001C4B600E|nr:isoleucine--tRNA ligase, cytoplasmic-like [Sceloporus undulatus]